MRQQLYRDFEVSYKNASGGKTKKREGGYIRLMLFGGWSNSATMEPGKRL